tara:strand:+ start:911 stop:2680 length:1770 start_codon:yes stop_codon:yes gene_type:complete
MSLVSNGKVPTQVQTDNLLKCYQTGRFNEAERLAISMIREFPKYKVAWQVLGAVLKQLGRSPEAVSANQNAVALSPRDSYSHYNLGTTLKEVGRLEEAEKSFRQAIALKPDFAEAYNNLGATVQALSRLEEAIKIYKNAITLKSDYIEAYYNLGIVLKDRFRIEEAERNFRQAIVLKPDFAEAHNGLGAVLKELGRLDEAEASYRHAIMLRSDYAEAHCNLGTTLKTLGKLDDAKVSFSKAIAFEPNLAEAHRHLTLVKKFDSHDQQYKKMKELYLDKNISREELCHINFALAKACEDLGEFEQAFAHYNEGNALRKKLLNYDITKDVDQFDQLRSSYSQLYEHSLAKENFKNELIPIFIVGMPRSGTTLVEQIISSHSLVTGAGELFFANEFGASVARGVSKADTESLFSFREKYLAELLRVSNDRLFVTDKMPNNFRYIGLIVSALPEAKIIHVKRNPAAVCWANYKQYFHSKTLGYCYSLNDVIRYYGLYEDLMGFWGKTLSKSIYSLDYELLTVNQNDETRKLIEHLGLDWDEKCLFPQNNRRSVATASNTQVRKKIYQGSSRQWEKYKPFLKGQLDCLDYPLES